MRILRVAQKVYPETKGGGAYHVHAMSRDQAAMGHDVTVLTVGDRQQREQRDGYTLIRCSTRLSLHGNDIAPGIWRHLRSTDEYDVIHAHSHLYFSTNLAALRRRLGETPLAMTNHGLYSQNVPEWLFDTYLRTLGRWTFDSADVVFCYTDEDRDRLRKLGGNTSIEVVHNGIDTERFTPEGPEYDDIVGDPAVLFVGRLVEGKRPGDALAAFARLRGEFPDAGLTFCGEGSLRDKLEQQAKRLDIRDAVQFLGHVPYDEMPSVYRAANALILPSRAEGLPRTILEAMASDVPVVVSDLKQVAATVASGGKTVPVGDISAYATGLKEVIEGEYTPRSRVTRRFVWEDTVERTTEELWQIAKAD